MTVIWVSKGEAEYVGGTITEKSGKNISADQIVVGVGTYWTPPAKADAVAADVDQPGATTADRLIKKLIDALVPVGAGRQLWAWITDSPEIEPIRLDDTFDVK